MDLKEIVSEMNRNAERIAKELLLKGIKAGREWHVGSLNGENGKSMKICIAGDKIGIWSDFAAGESGDLLDLWRQVRGMTITGSEATTPWGLWKPPSVCCHRKN